MCVCDQNDVTVHDHEDEIIKYLWDKKRVNTSLTCLRGTHTNNKNFASLILFFFFSLYYDRVLFLVVAFFFLFFFLLLLGDQVALQ